VTVRCTSGRLDSPQERGAAPCGTATGGWPAWLLRPPWLPAPRPRQRRRRLPASTILAWRRVHRLCVAPEVGLAPPPRWWPGLPLQQNRHRNNQLATCNLRNNVNNIKKIYSIHGRIQPIC
jgi:hypothetical protein